MSEDGFLEVCNKSYDKKVAGVISGAGDFNEIAAKLFLRLLKLNTV